MYIFICNIYMYIYTHTQTVTKKYFEECLDSLRGAMMIAFPESLPEWDDVPLILKGVSN